jgi:hypothetical protein
MVMHKTKMASTGWILDTRYWILDKCTSAGSDSSVLHRESRIEIRGVGKSKVEGIG